MRPWRSRCCESAGAPWSDAGAIDAGACAPSRRGSPAGSSGGGSIIFDVAHNPDGVRVLCESLEAVRPRAAARLPDHRAPRQGLAAMLAALAPHVDRSCSRSPPSVPAERAWSVDGGAGQFAPSQRLERGWREPDFDRALAAAARVRRRR